MPAVLAEAVSAALFGSLVSLIFAATAYLTETGLHRTFGWLERRGLLLRLSPDIKPTQDHFQAAAAYSHVLSTFPPAALMYLYRQRLLATATWDCSPSRLVLFVLSAIALHDAYFFALHTLAHNIKPLYRRLHQKHHLLEGDLNVFGTADMEIVEAFAQFMGYYLALAALNVAVVGSWSPLALLTVILVEAPMNMSWHSGYHIPNWLHYLLTCGIAAVAPGVSGSRTHYIHHLDPRYNRGLYFTWWDRWYGTHKDDHPRITHMTQKESREYDMKAFKMLSKQIACRLPSLTARADRAA